MFRHHELKITESKNIDYLNYVTTLYVQPQATCKLHLYYYYYYITSIIFHVVCLYILFNVFVVSENTNSNF